MTAVMGVTEDKRRVPERLELGGLTRLGDGGGDS